MTNYCMLSGKMLQEDEAWLPVSNRAFLYGDGLFESIYFDGQLPHQIELHYQRLLDGMNALNMQIPEHFSSKYLSEQICRLAVRNKIFSPSRVRIQVFREANGFYTPDSDFVAYLIQIKTLSAGIRELNTKGLHVEIFPGSTKPMNSWSGVKSVNATLFVQAGIWKRNFGYDDCLILNQAGRLCEAVSSNVFVVKAGKIYTPALSEACLPGIMRHQIIQSASSTGYEVLESEMDPEFLNEADEIFLSNAIGAVKWVGSYRKYRYFNTIGAAISKLILSNSHTL